ncbi:MAG: SusC/RagA family TonB-linked outer membrane protein, partial [Dysgonamonadaceae bacterium]|jgi:TonB-linked SusC/RagA family outer membrane protein|nr:SusC/RagA family TonB-linked outer membrane protein [Dysgonamonadaceae bacterium]
LGFKLLLLIVLINVSTAFSQQVQTVTGNVVDETGEPMVGVSITVKNTGTGTTTNIDGFYSLHVSGNNSVLVFSYLSYRTLEITVAGKTKIDVKMEEDLQLLDEIVVVGYGTQRKKDLTGSVSSIKSDAFNKGAINNNPLQLVEGKVAGLTITRTNGNDPNSGLGVQLRGVSSANGRQTPLVIIDGVPDGDLNTIAPQDIESIDVLKDGSAAAIYGTRGTNGVILVTTKKGKGGKAKVDFEAMLFTETIEKKLESLTANQYWQVSVEKNKPIIDKGYNTDWFDEMIKTPLSQMYNLSISGGSEDLAYRASVSYKDQDGIVSVPTNRETLNGRISLTQTNWNGRLKFDTNLAYSNIKSKFTEYEAFEQAIIRNPTYPVYNEDGSFCYSANPSEFDFNPVAYLHNLTRGAEYNRIMADLRISIEPVRDLKFSTMGALRKDLDLTHYYDPSTSEFNSVSGVDRPKGIAQRSTSNYTARTFEAIADYFKQMDKHKFYLMGGYTYQDFVSEGFDAKNQDFSSDAFLWNNLANGTYLKNGKAEMNSSKSSNKLIAFLGRITYSYDEKYLLTASLRREGSSRFGVNHKWGNFPAISAGWRIGNESFMKEIGWLSDLKIRAGYGLTGNEMNSNYISIARMGQQQYVLHNGTWILTYGPSTNPNYDLKWEVKQEANFGFDASFLKDRLGITFDVYNRKNSDLLYQVQASVPALIHDQVWANVGDMKSSGIELVLSGVPVMQKDLNWNISANISHNKSRLVSLSNNKYVSAAKYLEFGYLGAPGILGNTIRLEEGGNVGNFYGFKYLGLTENGKWIFDDVDSNGIYDDKDKQVIGNGVPKYFAGLTTNLNYKRFELTLSLRGAFKFQVLNAKEIYYGNLTTFPSNNLLVSVLDKNKDINDIPQYSSYYLEKGDYLKISNMTLGYNFDTKKFSQFVSALRLYISADNLYTFTKYSGIDPELASNGFTTGIDNRTFYPRTRTFTFGVSLSF